MEYIIQILVSILLPLPIIVRPLKEIVNKNKVFKDYKYEFIVFVVMLTGCLTRLIGLSKFPNGLNPDETSSAYEAWSILNYGIDRNGKTFPVFLISWGSGQNALYTYLLIPFIKIFGLTEFATRLPMAIISSISLLVIYYLFKELFNKRLGLIAIFFLAISPWHIMKSRYGLESNIFPDIILLSMLFIILYLKREKIRYMYSAFGLLGLSAYAYGTSYFFLPFFAIPLLIYLVLSKKLKIKSALIALIILIIIAIPIIIMVIINTFDLPEIKLGIFTIPRLESNRYEEISSVFSPGFLKNSINNFEESLKIVLLQKDNFIWNALPIFGVFYLFSIPLTIVGIVYSFRKDKNVENKIINFWFIAAILMLFVVEPNMVRINIIWIPLIIYTIIGIDIITVDKKINLYLIFTVYILAFLLFEFKYLTTKVSYPMFIDNAKEVIQYLDDKDNEIYMQYNFKEPYIYVAFYNKIEPTILQNTIEHFNKGNIFLNVKTIGKYHFYLPENIQNTNEYIYVINKDNNLNIDYNEFDITEIRDFLVLEYKEN